MQQSNKRLWWNHTRLYMVWENAPSEGSETLWQRGRHPNADDTIDHPCKFGMGFWRSSCCSSCRPGARAFRPQDFTVKNTRVHMTLQRSLPSTPGNEMLKTRWFAKVTYNTQQKHYDSNKTCWVGTRRDNKQWYAKVQKAGRAMMLSGVTTPSKSDQPQPPDKQTCSHEASHFIKQAPLQDYWLKAEHGTSLLYSYFCSTNCFADLLPQPQ